MNWAKRQASPEFGVGLCISLMITCLIDLLNVDDGDDDTRYLLAVAALGFGVFGLLILFGVPTKKESKNG